MDQLKDKGKTRWRQTTAKGIEKAKQLETLRIRQVSRRATWTKSFLGTEVLAWFQFKSPE